MKVVLIATKVAFLSTYKTWTLWEVGREQVYIIHISELLYDNKT